MKTKGKVIWVLGAAFLSAAVVLATSPVQAESRRRGGRSGATSERRDRSRDSRSRRSRSRYESPRSRGRDRSRSSGIRIGGGSGISISFGRGANLLSGAQRRFVPGHYETRVERVLVRPGRYEWQYQRVLVEAAHYEMRHTAPVTETVYDSCGNPHEVIVRPGRVVKVWVPDRYETRKVQVWVPPVYETRTVRVWVAGCWVSQPGHVTRGSGLNIRARIRF